MLQYYCLMLVDKQMSDKPGMAAGCMFTDKYTASSFF